MVVIHQEINKDGDYHPFEPATDKLIRFIDAYGVDYADDWNRSVMFYIGRMNEEQVGIVLSKKPDLSKNTRIDIYSRIVMKKTDRLLYILQRILDQDDRYILVNVQFDMHAIFYKFFRQNRSRLLEFCKCAYQGMGGSVEYYGKYKDTLQKAIIMLENHEKRYYSFFDLMKRQFEIK